MDISLSINVFNQLGLRSEGLFEGVNEQVLLEINDSLFESDHLVILSSSSLSTPHRYGKFESAAVMVESSAKRIVLKFGAILGNPLI